MWKISSLKLADNSYSYNDNGSKSKMLPNLSKINIFVGPNNSGKSRFMRSILRSDNLVYLRSSSLDTFNQDLSQMKSEIKNHISRYNIRPAELETILNSSPVDSLSLKNNNFKFLLEFKNQLQESFKKRDGFWPRANSYSYKDLAKDLMTIYEKWMGQHQKLIEELSRDPRFALIYIPVLRGLRSFPTAGHEDVYERRTKDDYFKDRTGAVEVFTGLNVYDKIAQHYAGTHKQRKILADFENYLSENFFDGEPIKLIPPNQPDQPPKTLIIKIGNEKEQPIYHLGDGIQSIIILTFPLFFYKEKSLLVFIEEPEHLLHPGLQRKLIETLSRKEGFENYQYFMTTHSNHFLDITLDFNNVSIFSVKKELDDTDADERIPSFVIENLSQGNKNALELLGVRNSSVFLSNCTVWVEGITDREYIRHYLLLYQESGEVSRKFEEDIHYSFVEYAGKNITHWSVLNCFLGGRSSPS